MYHRLSFVIFSFIHIWYLHLQLLWIGQYVLSDLSQPSSLPGLNVGCALVRLCWRGISVWMRISYWCLNDICVTDYHTIATKRKETKKLRWNRTLNKYLALIFHRCMQLKLQSGICVYGSDQRLTSDRRPEWMGQKQVAWVVLSYE